MPNNVIQYTSRTYNTILNDINSNSELVDKPSWWKKLWAGVGDVISLWLNAQANDLYLDTAFTEESVDKLLTLIDYQRTPKTTSSGTLLFHINPSAVLPYTVLQSNLIAFSEGSLSVASKRFETNSALLFDTTSETFIRSSDSLVVARVFITGELVRVVSTVTLPAPLLGGTDYYAIYVDATHIKLASSQSNAYNGIFISLTSEGSGIHTIYSYSKSTIAYQKETKSSYMIGTSDGVSEWQEFDLSDLNILDDTISVTVDSIPYTKVDTFIYSGISDTVFRVFYRTDGTAFIRFGNGVYGTIPPALGVYASYAIGGGVDSNVTALNKINSYGGGDTNIYGVTNSSSFSGGANRESIQSAVDLAPVLLKTRDRFVTVEDGVSLVLGYGGVSRTQVIKNFYGVLSCKIPIVPFGGGNPSSDLKTALETYLTDKTVLESVYIRVVDPVYVPTDFTSQIKMLSGYVFADIKDMYELAVSLLLSELTYEIYQTFISQGIASAVTFINTLWSFSFTSNHYTQISTLLSEVIPHNFGVEMQESVVYSFLSNVTGIDYITISVPSSFPINFASDEISQIGTIITTEIS